MTQRKVIYFDNNATTRIAPEVLEAMLPFLTEKYGNASSAYTFGSQVSKYLTAAREKVAALINAEPREITFTSCGTESNNTAINSALLTQPGKRHIITTAVEHSAIMNHCKFLQKQGCDVTFLPVEADGTLDLCDLSESIQEETAIVSVMWANNETGVLYPIEEIAAICRSKGVHFHTDAVQTPGKVPLDVKSAGVDMLSLSAHKLHAPKGIGMLYVRKGVKFQPYLMGGHQEHGRRAGTENVPYIVAFGRAAELAMESIGEENSRVKKLRDRLEDSILKTIPRSTRNGSKTDRLPNTTNISFEGAEAEGILHRLNENGICVSSGSACTTGALSPSHVLTAMGVPVDRAKSALRFSLGIYNSESEVDAVLKVLPGIVAEFRSALPNKNRKAPSETIHA